MGIETVEYGVGGGDGVGAGVGAWGCPVTGSGNVGGMMGNSGGPAGRDGAQEAGTSNIANINPIISFFFMIASSRFILLTGRHIYQVDILVNTFNIRVPHKGKLCSIGAPFQFFYQAIPIWNA